MCNGAGQRPTATKTLGGPHLGPKLSRRRTYGRCPTCNRWMGLTSAGNLARHKADPHTPQTPPENTTEAAEQQDAPTAEHTAPAPVVLEQDPDDETPDEEPPTDPAAPIDPEGNDAGVQGDLFALDAENSAATRTVSPAEPCEDTPADAVESTRGEDVTPGASMTVDAALAADGSGLSPVVWRHWQTGDTPAGYDGPHDIDPGSQACRVARCVCGWAVRWENEGQRDRMVERHRQRYGIADDTDGAAAGQQDNKPNDTNEGENTIMGTTTDTTGGTIMRSDDQPVQSPRLTGALAAVLGDGWTVMDDAGRWMDRSILVGPEYALTVHCLTSHRAADRGKVEIRGVLPSGWSDLVDYCTTNPVIRVSANRAERDPAAVVADIRRRLLPGFLALRGKIEAGARREAARAAQRATLVGRLTSATGGFGERWGNNTHSPDRITIGTVGDPVQAGITTSHGAGEVKLEIELTDADQAVNLVELLASFAAQHGQRRALRRGSSAETIDTTPELVIGTAGEVLHSGSARDDGRAFCGVDLEQRHGVYRRYTDAIPALVEQGYGAENACRDCWTSEARLQLTRAAFHHRRPAPTAPVVDEDHDERDQPADTAPAPTDVVWPTETDNRAAGTVGRSGAVTAPTVEHDQGQTEHTATVRVYDVPPTATCGCGWTGRYDTPDQAQAAARTHIYRERTDVTNRMDAARFVTLAEPVLSVTAPAAPTVDRTAIPRNTHGEPQWTSTRPTPDGARAWCNVPGCDWSVEGCTDRKTARRRARAHRAECAHIAAALTS
ncbi:hypothetical protein [Longimycelium tulufanense]|uniref:hypothetical protein n=1 Tax=Longimycelium tulufanense TaxID=907463 RepID=UPI00166C29A9|nr:hypothetical protein [Longimycelium tulufanense]